MKLKWNLSKVDLDSSENLSQAKIESSPAKIDENFVNYFLKTKDKNKWFIVLKYMMKRRIIKLQFFWINCI